MKDLISVVIPVYNVEKYVSKCIDSVLQQTYSQLEIILVDDGSTDKSPMICNEYVEKDNRIQVIHKENGGLSDARNCGIKQAKGKYIMFVDSDDYMDTKMIQTLYDLLMANQAKIAICSYYNVYEDGSLQDVINRAESVECITGKECCCLYERPWDELLMCLAWNKLYLTSLFDDIEYPVGKKHEDEYTTYKVLYKADKVVFTLEKLYYYLQRKDSIMSANRNDRIIDRIGIEALEERIKFMFERSEYKIAGKICPSYYNSCIDRYDTMVQLPQSYSKEECKEMRQYYRKNYPMIWKADIKLKRKIYYGIFCFNDKFFRTYHFKHHFKIFPLKKDN